MSRELLEKAAKAAGMRVRWCLNGVEGDERECFIDEVTSQRWEPQDDDGDAFRLAVKLRIDILFDGTDSPNAHVETVANIPSLDAQPWAHEPLKFDPYAATRLAIVRAAAMGEKP